MATRNEADQSKSGSGGRGSENDARSGAQPGNAKRGDRAQPDVARTDPDWRREVPGAEVPGTGIPDSDDPSGHDAPRGEGTDETNGPRGPQAGLTRDDDHPVRRDPKGRGTGNPTPEHPADQAGGSGGQDYQGGGSPMNRADDGELEPPPRGPKGDVLGRDDRSGDRESREGRVREAE
jgi:hypothetical protein